MIFCDSLTSGASEVVVRVAGDGLVRCNNLSIHIKEGVQVTRCPCHRVGSETFQTRLPDHVLIFTGLPVFGTGPPE
jgi:hypothetical protein